MPLFVYKDGHEEYHKIFTGPGGELPLIWRIPEQHKPRVFHPSIEPIPMKDDGVKVKEFIYKHDWYGRYWYEEI